MTIAIGQATIEHDPIFFTPNRELIVSQISFDIRDFIPSGLKPSLSYTGLYGFLFGDTETIRLGDAQPSNALGADGDWFIVNGGTAYQKINGVYVETSAPIGYATVTFTYQGWRAIGAVTGRCVTGPPQDQILSSSRYIRATSTFTGDVVIT